MSGLDGGAGGGTNTAQGTGGEDVSVRGQPPVQRTHQQASDLLDARVAAKRAAAEDGEFRVARDEPKAAPKAATKAQAPKQAATQRGPDGKFLPAGQVRTDSAAASEVDGSVSPDEVVDDATPVADSPPDPEIEKIKTEHAALAEKVKASEKRDGEWDQIANRTLARFKADASRIAHLEAQLAGLGGTVDPTVMENVRLQERLHAIELAEEHSAATAAQQAQAQKQAERAQAMQRLEGSTKAALTKYPGLLKSGPDLKEYLTLVWRGGDPMSLAEVYAQRADKVRQQAPAQPMAPRTLAGMGKGSGGPKLKDIEDIREKWHRINGSQNA